MIAPLSSISPAQNHSAAETVSLGEMWRSLRISLAVLIGLWILVIWLINPVGEFMVNDDWSFIRALEKLVFEGRIGSTGWGPNGSPGGPALIAHLSWGTLFTHFLGHSITTLRISVIVMGILGSVAFLVLVRTTGVSALISLFATLTLVFSPLFLPLCFSFMTDISFVSLAIFSVLFLHQGVARKSSLLVALGLLLALGSILTRQIGIVVPLGFGLACWIHPKGKALGRWKMLIMTVGLAVIPWLGFEFILFLIGSTPITDHQVIKNIAGQFSSMGFLDYLGLLCRRLVFGFIYVGYFMSPVVALRYREFLGLRAFRWFVVLWACMLLMFETAVIAGFIDPPVLFWRNILVDFGVGPILLKDTYQLGVTRSVTIPVTLYYFLVSWGILSLGGGLVLVISSVRRIARLRRNGEPESIHFVTIFCLFAGLVYLGIVLLTGFHDRYLMPVCMFGIIWVVSDLPESTDVSFHPIRLAPSWIPLLFAAIFTVGSLHDFMELKRAQEKALDYLVNDVRVDPCEIDGGFEFNGYHCYRQAFQAKPGLSWWWVDREEYVVSLGPLPGYRSIKTFPFKRYIGPSGAIHVLKPRTDNEIHDPDIPGKRG